MYAAQLSNWINTDFKINFILLGTKWKEKWYWVLLNIFLFFYYPSGIIFIKKNKIKTNFKKFSSILHSFLTRPSSRFGFWVLTGSPGSIFKKKSKRRRFSKKNKVSGLQSGFWTGHARSTCQVSWVTPNFFFLNFFFNLTQFQL
jgi:hypothetical protein